MIFITPYIKEDNSGHGHLTALRQLRKYLEDAFKMEFRKNLKIPSEVLGNLQYSNTKSSGACQTRGHEAAHMTYIDFLE
jgi:hypothetical protein